MVVLEILHGRFMNFRFDSICNITREPQQLQRFNCACGFISKSFFVIKHQLLSKVQVLTGYHVLSFMTSYDSLYPP